MVIPLTELMVQALAISISRWDEHHRVTTEEFPPPTLDGLVRRGLLEVRGLTLQGAVVYQLTPVAEVVADVVHRGLVDAVTEAHE